MYHLNASDVLLSKSASSLSSEFGTALGNSDLGRDTLGPLSFWLSSQVSFLQQIELQCTQAARVNEDLGDVFIRSSFVQFQSKPILDRSQGGRWLIKLSNSIVSVDSIHVNGVKLYRGFDFEHVGSRLIVRDKSLSLASLNGAVCEGVVYRTFVQEYLYSAMFGYSDFSNGSRRLFDAMQRSLRDGLTAVSLSQMVSAAIGCECVTKSGTVIDIVERQNSRPVVVTDAEVIRGFHGDTAAVSVGDSVEPGDMVFSSVRIWDCSLPPPDYMTVLRIPQSVLRFRATGPISVSSTPSSPTFVAGPDGNWHTRYAVTGSSIDIARYFEAQDAAEVASGFYLSNYLANSNIVPVAGLQSRQYNWIQVLWATWLRFGALVVKVSYPDSSPISDLQRYRLEQIRRNVPPWILLIVQAEVNAEHVC